jgi:hypothetical protein
VARPKAGERPGWLPKLATPQYGARLTVRGGDRLSEEMILAWADAYDAATGKWPTFHSREEIAATGHRWSAVDAALRRGHRGLPGGDEASPIHTCILLLLETTLADVHPRRLGLCLALHLPEEV